ncbi:MAG TPA: serine/threonine-protein kinase [Gemmataceae bacterium]|nr:serine/threonine-protein kinase [Gemmataceae bacterium]
MPDHAKSDAGHAEEERLAHALVSRGLLTREEAQQCRAGDGDEAGARPLLARLVRAGLLTAPQARRAAQELPRLVGERIPGYELLDKLGQGSMGTVYKARQLSMNRLVAVKVLHPRLAANPEFLRRFTREAHLAAKLSHNNIVQAIDVGSAGVLHYFVMEYVEGVTIKEELERGKIYEEREAVDIALQVAQALAHASKRGLIHRDIKPANVVRTADGIAKLADLGMARETADERQAHAEKGMAIGTPHYMAPEQVRGREDIDVRADIYSLGATLYHMVTGQPPFPMDGVDAVLLAHVKEELTPPDHLNTKLSSGLGEVVEFMMAKDRRQRYRTPEDLIIDLECLLNGEPPKLARQRIEAGTLKGLAEGESDEPEPEGAAGGVPAWWLAVLGGLLGLSALLNLILLLRR